MDNEYKYMVCTRCYTYNQTSFIEDTLNGFYIQNTTFPVVYCIVDDASTDGEQDVLRKWAKSHLYIGSKAGESVRKTEYGELIIANQKNKSNQLFVILLLSENHKQNGRSKLQYLSEWMDNSKYIALCEGDDYWIDSLKLQKQVLFLDDHDDFVMTYTGSIVIDENSQKVIHREPKHLSGNITKELLIRGNFIDTATVCFKNKEKEWKKVLSEIPFPLLMGDKPRWIFYSTLGKIQFLRDKTTVYRCLPESASHTKDYRKLMAFVDNTEKITCYFNELFKVGIKERAIKKKYDAARVRESAKLNRTEFQKQWKQYLSNYPCGLFNIRLDIIAVIRILFNKAV